MFPRSALSVKINSLACMRRVADLAAVEGLSVCLSVCLTIGKLFCLGILSLQVKNDSEEERYTVLWTERALTRRINSFVETHNYVQVT